MAEPQVKSPAASRADFPIEWSRPEDAKLYWNQDPMHFPEPQGPLTNTFEPVSFDRGAGQGFAEFGMPVRMRADAFNGYVYNAAQLVSTDPAELERMGRESDERARAAAMSLERDWNERYLPELKADIDVFRKFNYAGASDAALADHIDWVVARRIRHWHLHFLIVLPAFGSVNAFTDMFAQMLKTTDEFEAHTLLQGLNNLTVQGGVGLWRLSRQALKSRSVRDALAESEPDAVFARLKETPEGREFAEAFRAYLDEFGWRGDSWNMDDRTWADYPKRPLTTLRGYLSQPDEASPELVQANLAAKREQAIAGVRTRLAGIPAEDRQRFEGMLHLAQIGNILHEDHNYYIDQALQHRSRHAFVEVGKRLVARGRITSAEDVLYLTVPELQAAIRSSDRSDLRDLIDERRKEHERQRMIVPPRFVGTPPPPDAPPNPILERLVRFFGGSVEQPKEATQIRGNAGSRGMVTGIALVATNLEQAAELQPGEILVCTTTAPPWTPLFATAAAVVTDTGGILSHCAVVAREFGIPAVVGTHVATARIKTGQRLTVDGSRGIVTIEPD